MKYEVIASTSTGEYYPVVASDESGSLTITCNCTKGKNGKICNHRLALASGTPKKAFNPNKAGNEKIEDVRSFVESFPAISVFRELNAELEVLEDRVKEIKRQMGMILN
ncbi:hypothetical protein [Buttiauxella gaviniae]|uniref:hypothetical protein n=1 Tax=Buttiauxella gaviniae TaxID=82990 RepID=UPI003975EF77